MSDTLELHDLYQRNAACGYDRALTLPQHAIQSIAARLRGISAIAAVLTADATDDVDLGEWMRGGLVDAIGALSEDASGTLDRHNAISKEG